MMGLPGFEITVLCPFAHSSHLGNMSQCGTTEERQNITAVSSARLSVREHYWGRDRDFGISMSKQAIN